jgi:phosphatidyl-myo-inositol alpha-mannosyltransferase
VKLAVTNPYSWPEVRRGAERIIVETARCMAARGHQVTIYTAGDRAERRVEDGVKTVKLRRRFTDPAQHEQWFGRRITPHLALGRFDAVHSMMPYDALAAIRTRPLARHRSIYEELGSPIRDFWKTLPDGELRERLVHDVDVYGCMSNFSLDILQKEWGRTGDLIPGGVRLSEFTPSKTRDPRPTILFSGALSEFRKGLSVLLAACDIVMQTYPDLQVWLSGPGSPDEALREATPRVRRSVTFLPIGDPRELARRYANAWVTALPSLGDSFGMVLVESLASGTPIVVSDHSAPPQLVTPATGVVSRPSDPSSLADALAVGFGLAQDPATAAHCREFARQFDWDESIGPLLEKLYRGTS